MTTAESDGKRVPHLVRCPHGEVLGAHISVTALGR